MTAVPSPAGEQPTEGERVQQALGRWLFERDYRERGLCSPSDASWDEWVERNQDQWVAEARELLECLAVSTAVQVAAPEQPAEGERRQNEAIADVIRALADDYLADMADMAADLDAESVLEAYDWWVKQAAKIEKSP